MNIGLIVYKMKTLLYLGAGLDVTPILHQDFDRLIYVDNRPLDNLNDNILDDFITCIKSHGFRVKITEISYIHPFYIKCFNDKKFIKYYFNTHIPTHYMLAYESLDTIYISPTYKDVDVELVKHMLKPIMKEDCQIFMQTSNLQHCHLFQTHS